MSFLTDEEIERLTGCKRHADQLGELSAMGIRHRVNRRREIVVTWSAVEAVLGPQGPVRGPTDQPDMAAFS
jgi:hypothetical protein